MLCLAPLLSLTPSVMERLTSDIGRLSDEISTAPSVIRNDCDDILPTSFVPTDMDVICGRARENFHHGTKLK
jgi:hypothetical protein